MKIVNSFVQSERQNFLNPIRAFLPQNVVIPLSNCHGDKYSPAVQPGDSVSEGQVIATPKPGITKQNAALIHSPVPGKVTQISTCTLPNGKISKAICIRVVGSFTYLGKKVQPLFWESFTPSYINEVFSQKGVMNTFLNEESLSSQIDERKNDKIKTLVVRLFDEDTSRMTDKFVAEYFTNQILEGAQIVAKAYDADHIVFMVPMKNQMQLNLENFRKIPAISIEVNTSKYPVGFKQNLIKQISENSQIKVNSKSLFVDSLTLFNAFNAVVYGIPVVEQLVHITGNCLRSAGMFKVRLGATIGNLAEQCGGFKTPVSKIIINGMIVGNAVTSMDVPVTQQIKSVMFVPSNDLSDQRIMPCIRCGKCREICPENLFPDLIYRHHNGGKQVGKELLESSILCSSCSLCNSVCPSRLPLSQTINLVKEKIYEK